MSYDIERKVLANYINSQSFFGLSPFGLDGDPAVLTDNSGFLTIISGRGREVSTGAPGANCHEYAGIVAITVVTPGKDGAAGVTSFVDTIEAAFRGLKLDETGNQPTASSVLVIDFGRKGFVPHVADKIQEAPFLRTVIHAPFTHSKRQ